MKVMERCALVLMCIGLFVVGVVAEGVLDPKLRNQMSSSPGPFQVIVTFKSISDVRSLDVLGVVSVPLTTLPMSGAVLTTDQITTVLSWDNVESVYLNDRLAYTNHTSGEITGVHYVQRSMGYTGKGVTVLVLDSGIDGTHPDVPFGPKVIQNVKIVSDLGVAGATAIFEGVINTDNTSGHGTHVSGTVGGTGAASATDERDPFYYRGAAPDAKLVGVGAGEALFIFSALQGFDYAIGNKDRYGIQVITNSWGNSSSQYDPNDPVSRASYEAYRRGIVVTFAAGNDGPGDNTMSTYAISPWVMGVAAGTSAKGLADFSSRGESGDAFEHPDITAPGVNITSTRAIGTPVGALGPVADPLHPSYTQYYHTISGTSMATPFVAGSVALLLDANAELSPDQIEDILVSTADPMPGYSTHQVGSGYINVQAAVTRALATTGRRQQFLTGDTKWSSQGAWTIAEESDQNIGYYGSWKSSTDQNASGGTYSVGSVKLKGGRVTQRPYARIAFYGSAIKMGYPTNSTGGTAEVVIDGISRGSINYYSETPTWTGRSAYTGLARGGHVLELRGLTGRVYLDNVYLDGRLFASGTEFTETSQTYTGSMGPSVEGTPESRLIPFSVSDNTVEIRGEIAWTGGVDIDLYLLDPNGARVASGASLANPEVLSYWVTVPGTYTYEVVGYATVTASYTLNNVLVQASSQSGNSAKTTTEELRQPRKTAAVQNDAYTLNNYPNPFNPRTSIRYNLAEGQNVRVTVVNILGSIVRLLDEGNRSAGWHSVDFDASDLPSGMYFCRLEAGPHSRINKLLYLK